MKNKKIKLNGREMTIEEFEERKLIIFQTKGMKLTEVSPGEYKTRLQG